MLRQRLSTFICTFVIFSILLLFVAAVAGLDSYKEDFSFDAENLTVTAFGKNFAINKNIPKAAIRLLSFNDTLFGNGFSDFARDCADTLLSFSCDVTKILFGFIKNAVS